MLVEAEEVRLWCASGAAGSTAECRASGSGACGPDREGRLAGGHIVGDASRSKTCQIASVIDSNSIPGRGIP